jgi:hypothetical protein
LGWSSVPYTVLLSGMTNADSWLMRPRVRSFLSWVAPPGRTLTSAMAPAGVGGWVAP